ncbi:hypothetical protein [Actinokineospora sp.]|uniref:hypothetical protein n=1 Tax=Actinokineospora sp. TaxID=1872133 RepID=UPI003D6C4E5C
MPAAPVTAVLVHSPFLGPASLRPLADALAALGHPAVLLDLRLSVVASPVHQRLIGAFADALSDVPLTGPVVLVGHSAAGPLLPAFAEDLEDAVAGLVYLDAGLPTPGQSWRETVAPEVYDGLYKISRNGRLPRWPDWFDADPLPDLVHDEALRAEIADEAPEVPIAFLKEARPSVEWSGPSSYVCLSEAYVGELHQARELRWPTRVLDSHHLAPATDPGPVAAAVLEVL